MTRTAWIALAAMGQLVWTSAVHAQGAEAPPAQAPPVQAPPVQAPPVAPSVEVPPAPYGPPPGYPAPRLRKPMTFRAGPVVHLTTDNEAGRLQMMQLKWTNICVAPCDAPVDPNGIYRIGGGTVRPSDEFRMPRSSGIVNVNARVGSTVKHWVGFGMILGGALSMLSGGIFIAASSDAQVSNADTTSPRDTLKAEGIIYLVIGVIVTAIGIPLAASSTSVDVR
jgi:hypothetical protein